MTEGLPAKVTLAPDGGGATLTTTASSSGLFSFASSSTDYTVPPGGYTLTVSSTGYQTTSEHITIESGDTPLDRSLYVTPVTLKIGLQLSDKSLYDCQDGCTVELLSTDGAYDRSVTAPDDDTSQFDANRFIFSDLIPRPYTIVVTGTHLGETRTPYTLQLGLGTDPVTRFDVPVQFAGNTVTGLIQGPVGLPANNAGLTGVPVQLGTVDDRRRRPDEVHRREGYDKAGLTQTTDSSPTDGFFEFDNVKDGSYVLQVNAGADAVSGYRPVTFQSNPDHRQRRSHHQRRPAHPGTRRAQRRRHHHHDERRLRATHRGITAKLRAPITGLGVHPVRRGQHERKKTSRCPSPGVPFGDYSLP